MTQDSTDHPQRTVFLSEQRWFAGKGRDFQVTDVEVLAQLEGGLRIELITVTYAEGEPATEVYQMPVVGYPHHQERLRHALIREGDGEWTYDALHDRDAMAVLYRAFLDGKADGLDVHQVAHPGLESDVHSTFLPAEQSNSSAVFGESAILKVFRKLTPGANPDIEIHEVLTEAGDPHVAHLYGWLSAETGGNRYDLAMLQQFLRTASDGWELAKSSVRNLLTEDHPPADGALAEMAGGDFGGEAHRLGSAIAGVHRVLSESFGTEELDTAALAEAMSARLRAATDVVPELAEHADGLNRIFDAVGALESSPSHRVHGDLHLGQTLRTSLGWKLVDFEGEPAKPLDERRRPDSPWRDVAGMVRSFHYAAAITARDLDASPDLVELVAHRADAWVEHNVAELLQGYAEERGVPISGDERVLLDAYVADKAVYEAAYEARNRPAWLSIPLGAIDELVKEGR